MPAVWQFWIIAGLALWTIEIFTPGFVVGVFGTACLFTAPVAAFGVSFELQLLFFGIASGVLALTIRPLMLRHLYRRTHRYSSNVDALRGAMGVVTEAIDSMTASGRVRIGTEEWRAVEENGGTVEPGQKVTVLSVTGSTIMVRLIGSNAGEHS